MLTRAIAPELLARPSDGARARPSETTVSVALRHTTVHLLDTVASHVSATDVRQRLERGQSIRGLVPRGVEEYIKKQALYRVEALHR
jgi:nicotinic acid mononucleotide adenylyltransferase